MYTNQSDQKDQKLPVKLVVDESIDFHQVKEIYKVFIECGEQEEKLLDLGTLEYMRYFKGQIIISFGYKICDCFDFIDCVTHSNT